jgi:hypothetical protein
MINQPENEAELKPTRKNITGTLMPTKSAPLLKLKTGELIEEAKKGPPNLEIITEKVVEEAKPQSSLLPLISTKSEPQKQVHFKPKVGKLITNKLKKKVLIEGSKRHVA